MAKRLVPALAILGLTGCAGLDRESYSLVIRKPAHRYERPTPEEKARQDELRRSMEASGRRMEDSIEFSPLAAFRPFAWCELHQSSHTAESLAAVAAAPAEYPLALTQTVATNFVLATIDEVARLLGLKPPPEPPPKRPDDPPR